MSLSNLKNAILLLKNNKLIFLHFMISSFIIFFLYIFGFYYSYKIGSAFFFTSYKFLLFIPILFMVYLGELLIHFFRLTTIHSFLNFKNQSYELKNSYKYSIKNINFIFKISIKTSLIRLTTLFSKKIDNNVISGTISNSIELGAFIYYTLVATSFVKFKCSSLKEATQIVDLKFKEKISHYFSVVNKNSLFLSVLIILPSLVFFVAIAPVIFNEDIFKYILRTFIVFLFPFIIFLNTLESLYVIQFTVEE